MIAVGTFRMNYRATLHSSLLIDIWNASGWFFCVCTQQSGRCICKKGDGGFKSLQKEIGGIQILVEIFQKNFLIALLGVLSYILDEKNQEKNFKFFSFFIGGTLMIFFKILWWFLKNKIVRVPLWKMKKKLKFFFLIFLVHYVAMDSQKCI